MGGWGDEGGAGRSGLARGLRMIRMIILPGGAYKAPSSRNSKGIGVCCVLSRFASWFVAFSRVMPNGLFCMSFPRALEKKQFTPESLRDEAWVCNATL